MLEGYSFWGTTNIKIAAGEATLGGKVRSVDPVTHLIKPDGQKQITFWFESGTGTSGEFKKQMEVKWHEMTCDAESPIRYIRAALENRDALLGLVKKAEPIQVICKNDQTLLVPVNSSPQKKMEMLRSI